jgi:hypothetical protein
MGEYIGTARANLAWAAWRRGDLAGAEAGARAALEEWARIATGDGSYSFQWTALWTLIGAALTRERPAEAVEYMSQLLEPEQQPPPAPLACLMADAVAAWARGDQEAAVDYLRRASDMATTLHYL